MGSMPLALSVHNFVSSVGADAGFASIIGLAVLVLLYFAHARETANLREEAAVLNERLQQAEARVAQLSRQPSVVAQASQPAQAARPAPAPAPAVAAGSLRFAPAGVGAPALAAATRVVPIATRPVSEPAVAAQARAPAMSVAAAGPSALTAPRPSAPSAPTAPEPESPASPRAPAPATAAGAVAGAVLGGNGAGQERATAAPVGVAQSPPPPRPRVPTRPDGALAAGRRTPPPLRGPAPRRSSAGRRFALLIGALGIVAVIAVLLIATSGSSPTKTSSSAARTTNAPAAHRSPGAAAFNPASVTVAVLNGTSTNELAHRVAAKLAAGGYKTPAGMVATASNQTQTATVVAYLPGAANRTDANHVASALKLGPASVQQIDQSTQQVACPQPSACTANVVVTVGADLATAL